MVAYDQKTTPSVKVVTLPCAQEMKTRSIDAALKRWVWFLKQEKERPGEVVSHCGRSGHFTKTEKTNETNQ